MGWCHNVLYLIPPTTSVNWKLLISGWTSMPSFNSCALLDKVLAKQYLRMNTYSIRNESCVIKFRWRHRDVPFFKTNARGNFFSKEISSKIPQETDFYLKPCSGVKGLQHVLNTQSGWEPSDHLYSHTFWSEALIYSELSVWGFSPMSYAILHCFKARCQTKHHKCN